MFQLNQQEKKRLQKGIQAAFAIPFLDDIEDFIWEAIFCYVKNIPLLDPLKHTRRKLLFDVVDSKKKVGWSAKALQWPISTNCQFELVIQRADIFTKAKLLGFQQLSLQSTTSDLGNALLRHWHSKIDADAATQRVEEKRICVLLKHINRKKYAYFEEELTNYTSDMLDWKWTDHSRTGLQGLRKSDGYCVFRWYPNQKQLFERFTLPEKAYTFELEPRRLALSEVVDLLLKALNNV